MQNKQRKRPNRGAFLRGSEVTVKLAGAKRFPALCRTMHNQYRVGVLPHNVGNLQKFPDERCRNRRILGTVSRQEREDLVFALCSVLVVLRIVVERPSGNRDGEPVGGVLDHVTGTFGQLVNELFVVLVDVGFQNFHDISHFLPVLPLGQLLFQLASI